jgi:hypothetical protein
MSTTEPRTREQIAFQCRVDRIVDRWQSAWLGRPDERWKFNPRKWSKWQWRDWSERAGLRLDDDPFPDAAMREAVIAEIDAIADRLDRRTREL